MWYTIHAIHYFEFEAEEQREFIVWEHLYLVEAQDPTDAHRKGVDRAKADETESFGSFTVNEKPARLRFAGIRKSVTCQNTFVQHDNPIDGTELSYNELLVESRTELDNLVSGEPAEVVYND